MLNDLMAQLQPYLTIFGAEPWKQAALIVVVFLILAWVLGYLINGIIHFFASRTVNKIDDQILRNLRRPLISSIFLMGLTYAGHALNLSDGVMKIVAGIVVSILILMWTSFAVKTIKILFTTMSGRANEHSFVRQETLPLFNNLFAIVLYGLAVYFLFNAWGINMTAWLASAGVAGIAIGFAAKDTLANLISGVFILADSPYKISDYVVLDDGSRGKITHIGIRSTRLLTRGDVEITVPNSIMGNSKIINQSGGPHLKFRIGAKISVAYDSDIDKVERILLEEAAKESLVCKYPVARVRFRQFGASGLDYELLCWIDEPELKGRVLHFLNTNIFKAFNREGIEIPFNKLDVNVKSMPS